MATPGSLIISVVAPTTDQAADSDNDSATDQTTSADGSSSSSDWLKLEQADWQDMPAGGFSGWLQENGIELTLDNITENLDRYQSLCANDGTLEVEILVKLSRSDLTYEIFASYGELSAKTTEETEHSESVDIEGEDSVDLEALVDGTISAEWEGKVWDMEGKEISPPKIVQSGSSLTWGEIKVIGTLRVSYSESHDHYILSIEPRDASKIDSSDPESAYQSTVRAVWSGGVEKLEVQLPDMTGDCASSFSKKTGEDQPSGDCYDLYEEFAKCTGEKISERLVRVTCPEDESKS